jgi:hypothetical protein
MLHSAFLRRSVAVLSIGAVGVSPAIPFAVFTLFGATVPAAKVSAAAEYRTRIGDPIPIVPPEDVEDGTGGVGGLPNLPPFPPLPIIPPEDVEDGTGGIGGHLP